MIANNANTRSGRLQFSIDKVCAICLSVGKLTWANGIYASRRPMRRVHSAASEWRRSGNPRRPQTSAMASASASINVSSWYGDGVMRSRSVLRGTVG